jgi:putative zinc finger/helix-turn-helix YgiT family protein
LTRTTCRKHDWKPATLAETRTIAGVTFTGHLAAQKCEICGETIVSGEVGKRFDLELAGRLAGLGLIAPEAFKFMRKALGLRASDLSQLLGTTPEAVSRWENGVHKIDRATFLALASLVRDRLEQRSWTTETLNAVAEQRTPTEPVVVS